ncbi:MAG: glycosyltransferase [Tildeniella nuda ZEHNDER 1965/U140]|jgi:hypothetical protein|nr:glycosyltransferase [Tildeniella nuda ZEHNDER 1965/U140]
MAEIGLGITLLSLVIWLVLLFGRGQFWRSDQFLTDEGGRGQEAGGRGQKAEGRRQEAEEERGAGEALLTRNSLSRLPTPDSRLPFICAIIPARNEADLLPVTLRSLLTQTYPHFQIVLIDDHSSDGTADVARQTAQVLDKDSTLTVVTAEPLPAGWTGKLWAMEQGIRYAETLTPKPDYFLLTDADIEHHPENLRELVAKAQADDLDLVSLMVLLRCKSLWEKLLIPAFVFFFQKLYPFRWANDPDRKLAAAAGGCILIRREALTQIGGLQILRQALIDDCSLAQAVKGLRGWAVEDRSQETAETRRRGDRIQNSSPHPIPHTLHPTSGKIWLGLTRETHSLRPYPSLKTIWDMVARTAFTQLNYSPLLLLGTLVGMTIVYVVPPVSTIAGLVTGNWAIALIGLTTWLLIAVAYLPTLLLYQCPPLLAFGLPAIALLYTLMTLDSALRHWRGKGGAWKGRVY